MFKRLKELIDSRLGPNIAIEDLDIDGDYFIKVQAIKFYKAALFLKNDPDTSLELFHQMIVLPQGVLPWSIKSSHSPDNYEILYQLKSLRLPYDVSIVVEVARQTETVPSICELFLGARFFEVDLGQKFGIAFESSDRYFLEKG